MLPGIIPRLKVFAEDGFGWLAMLMATIYSAVRLLPPTHPYLNPENKGRFGIRHVVAEAARHLVFDRKHIDQIIIFVVLLLGMVLMVAQFFILAYSLIFDPVYAMPAGLFSTPVGQRDTDIAFMLLDRVFAVPNLYESDFDPALIGMTPFSNGLHALFNFYNMAMLIVAVFIVLYYVVILVAETAQSGTPFGRRFDTIWAPIRLVVAVGLLVPVSYGYNSAQFIVLYSAKFGSSFATNAWTIYNQDIVAAAIDCGSGPSANAAGWCNEALIARPKTPDMMPLVQFMTMVKSCAKAYEILYKDLDGRKDKDGNALPKGMRIAPYLVRKTAAGEENQEITGIATPDWQTAVNYYNKGDILIVYGEYEARHTDSTGLVKPFCGEIVVPTTDLTQDGPKLIQEIYYNVLTNLWYYSDVVEFADKMTAAYIKAANTNPCSILITTGDVGACGSPYTGRSPNFPSSAFGQNLKSVYFNLVDAVVTGGHAMAINTTDFSVTTDILERGWGGAGIWYNKIAEWNGSFVSSTINLPTPKSMPLIMKTVEAQKSGSDQNMDALDRYEPYHAGKDRATELDLGPETEIAKMLSNIYKYWRQQNATEKIEQKVQANVFFDTLNAIFGLNGLFTIRQNTETHPMAQLASIGRSIVESAIRNLMVSMGFSFLGGMTEILNPHLGGAFHAISRMFVGITTIGLTVGFILYYVLPFLPFMYFYFAVGAWVKSIFEAMVGVPLWALAHLKIDGHGIHGDTAMNGYFLIFEIFIRPILTVFGLLAGMAVFAAMVKTLNGIFPLVTANLTGFEADAPKVSGKILGIEFKRQIVDEFFFTLIYTVIVYMIALSSFKMIDLVPNNILRWMGHGVHTFSENQGASMDNFIQTTAFGGAAIAGQGARALSALGRTVGTGVGAPIGMLSNAMGGAGRSFTTRGGAGGGGAGGGGAGGGGAGGGGGATP